MTHLLALLLGCSANSLDHFTAEPTEKVRTVVKVSWPADEDDESGWVMWGLGETPDQRVEATHSGRRFEALIPGQPQLTAVTVQPAVLRKGVEIVGELRSVETGLLPDGTPQMSVETPMPERLEDPLVLAAAISRENWIFILDRDAEIRWYYAIPEGYLALHIEMALEGGSMLFNLNHNDRTQDRSSIMRVSADGEVIENVITPRAHHTFTQAGEGVLAFPAITVQDAGINERVVGDIVLERSPDGELRQVFNCFNHLVVNFEDQAPFYPQGYDWTHANSLRYYPDRGTYLFSLANIDTVIEFDPETQEPLMMLGKEGSYIFDPPEAQFDFQHDVHWLDDDHILLFDSPQFSTGHARALELSIDQTDQVATQVWEGDGGRQIQITALGSVDRLNNGDTLTSWGAAGELIQMDPEGEVAWKLVSSLGSGFTTAQIFPGDEAIF